MERKTGYVLLALLAIAWQPLWAQTCSCAGDPLFDPVKFTEKQTKHWHLELTGKHHAINDLVAGSTILENDIGRERTSSALQLEIRYNISPVFSIISLFNYTRHERSVALADNSATRTSALGDSLISLQINPWGNKETNPWHLILGVGLKLPTGQADARTTGIASEDMQPGTGSWDALIWLYGIKNGIFSANTHLVAGFSFRINGANQREYHFGNELNLSLGLAHSLNNQIKLRLHGRFRQTTNDRRFNENVTNTGGKWVYLVPGFKWQPFKNVGFKAQLEIPVYRHLNGVLQFTSTYLAQGSIFFEF